MTCSSPDAYCVNATVKFIKWDFVTRSCSDDASIIKKLHKDFDGICTNNTCSNFNFPLDIIGSLCCCKNDYCNGSQTLFNAQLFFNLVLLVLVTLYFN
uniref:UPAR/Ly6 domain-containing protein n=1 Tax=Strongyloides venezuelensis TaxID=75913 RepID=A0A0K0FMR1_STRVS